jgi:hypothetical protein
MKIKKYLQKEQQIYKNLQTIESYSDFYVEQICRINVFACFV